MHLIRPMVVLSLAMIALGGLGLASCGGDGAYDLVGSPCYGHYDCYGELCLSGPAYPAGTCSLRCRDDRDCPSYSACVDRDGGVCLPLCQDSRECRMDYRCADQPNRGRVGTSPVCINAGASHYDVVGSPCSRHADCPGGQCLTGSRYPGGTCTYSCDDNRDCPSYAACIDRDGGVCLPTCDSRSDCRSGYLCSSQSNRGQPGRTDVCIAP